jgi:hypothetical protein
MCLGDLWIYLFEDSLVHFVYNFQYFVFFTSHMSYYISLELVAVFVLLPNHKLPIFLAMTKRLVLVWIVANFLDCQCSTTNSNSFFWPILTNLWARNSSTKILASQNFGRAILGTNQTHPKFMLCK